MPDKKKKQISGADSAPEKEKSKGTAEQDSSASKPAAKASPSASNSKPASAKASEAKSNKSSSSGNGGKKSVSVTKSIDKAVSKLTKNSQLFTAIALILIGILFCAFRTGLLNVLLTIVGAVLIALGIYELFRKDYVKGAVEIAVGIVIIVCGWVILDIALLLLGLAFIAYAIYAIVTGIPDIKAANGFNKVLAILNPIIVLIIGILLVVAKWELGDAICIVIGVIAIAEGALMLVKSVTK